MLGTQNNECERLYVKITAKMPITDLKKIYFKEYFLENGLAFL